MAMLLRCSFFHINLINVSPEQHKGEGRTFWTLTFSWLQVNLKLIDFKSPTRGSQYFLSLVSDVFVQIQVSNKSDCLVDLSVPVSAQLFLILPLLSSCSSPRTLCFFVNWPRTEAFIYARSVKLTARGDGVADKDINIQLRSLSNEHNPRTRITVRDGRKEAGNIASIIFLMQICCWSPNEIRDKSHDGRCGDSCCSAMCLRSSGGDGVRTTNWNCFFFPHARYLCSWFLMWEQPGQIFIPASPAEGLFQSECRLTVIGMYAPGISMVETTSASSSMSMMWRWKSLLLSDCR